MGIYPKFKRRFSSNLVYKINTVSFVRLGTDIYFYESDKSEWIELSLFSVGGEVDKYSWIRKINVSGYKNFGNIRDILNFDLLT